MIEVEKFDKGLIYKMLKKLFLYIIVYIKHK